jgi:hypothetical protein
MQGLTQAKNVADQAWQGLSLVQQTSTTLNTATTGAAVIATGQGSIAAMQQIGDAQMNQSYNTTLGAHVAQQAINYKPGDLSVALCAQATLGAGLGNAALQVATILTPKPAGTNVTSVRQNVGAQGGTPPAGILLSDPSMTYNSTKSKSQQVQEVATDIKAFFCDGLSNDDCKGLTNPVHADTEPVNFFKDRTFTDTEMLGFDQFEKYVCGLVPENTPKSAAFYKTAPGMTQLADQTADIARRNLCLQAYNEFYANHLPVVDSTTNNAIAAIYSNVTSIGNPTSNPVSGVANGGTMSREELLHALYQGLAEGQNGSSANIFTQIAQLDALPTLKMIAAELILNNYMQYDLHEKQTEANMYLSIIAKQSMGSGLH